MTCEYNALPDHAEVITDYEEIKRFFDNCIIQESRSPQYDPKNYMKGFFSLRIFWVEKELGLGFGITDNWKEKRIDFYKFGSKENWSKFRNAFASQFRGYNS